MPDKQINKMTLGFEKNQLFLDTVVIHSAAGASEAGSISLSPSS